MFLFLRPQGPCRRQSPFASKEEPVRTHLPQLPALFRACVVGVRRVARHVEAVDQCASGRTPDWLDVVRQNADHQSNGSRFQDCFRDGQGCRLRPLRLLTQLKLSGLFWFVNLFINGGYFLSSSQDSRSCSDPCSGSEVTCSDFGDHRMENSVLCRERTGHHGKVRLDSSRQVQPEV